MAVGTGVGVSVSAPSEVNVSAILGAGGSHAANAMAAETPSATRVNCTPNEIKGSCGLNGSSVYVSGQPSGISFAAKAARIDAAASWVTHGSQVLARLFSHHKAVALTSADWFSALHLTMPL